MGQSVYSGERHHCAILAGGKIKVGQPIVYTRGRSVRALWVRLPLKATYLYAIVSTLSVSILFDDLFEENVLAN